MKKTKEGKNKLEKKLLAYGVASGTAFAMATTASAAIIYTEANLDASYGSENIDMDNFGNDEFRIAHTASGAGTNFNAFAGIYDLLAGASWINQSGPDGAARLSYGENISYYAPGTDQWWGTDNNTLFIFSNGMGYGAFPGPGYIGVRFEIDISTHYGWIHIETDGAGDWLNISGWAYNDVDGASIKAGQQVIPIPSSLALLATGAAGLATLRRRNLKKEQSE